MVAFNQGIINKVGKELNQGKDKQNIANAVGLTLREVKFILETHFPNRINTFHVESEDINRVKKLHDQGFFRKKIAEKLGLKLHMVGYILRRYYPNRNKTIRTYNNNFINQIKKLREQGLLMREIGTVLNIPTYTVKFLSAKYITGDKKTNTRRTTEREYARKYNDKFINQIRNLMKKGLSMRAIGTALKVPRHTVRFLKEKYINGAKTKPNITGAKRKRNITEENLSFEQAFGGNIGELINKNHFRGLLTA